MQKHAGAAQSMDSGCTGEVAWGVRVWTSDGIAAYPKWTRTVEQVESGFRPKEMNDRLP